MKCSVLINLDNKQNKLYLNLKLEKPSEVLFEGADPTFIKKQKNDFTN